MIKQTLALVGLTFSVFTNAAMVVDQSNLLRQEPACHMSPSNLCGQSFQSSSSNITGSSIYLSPNRLGSGEVTLSIYESYSSSPTGLVASGVSGIVDSQQGWVDVFWSAASINSGQTYYMVLSSPTQLTIAATASGDVYAAGNMIALGNTSAYSSYDLTFKTYSEVQGPTAAWLLGSALFGLGLVTRNTSGSALSC
jgi:hypothetical protein